MFLFLNHEAEAKEFRYFDFEFIKNTLSPESEVEVNFIYNFSEGVSEERFKIKPRIENGTVEILENEGWVNENSLWTEASTLSRAKKLRIKGSFYKTDVWFEILDLKTGKIYTTPKHFILSRNWFEDYIKNLNEIIFEFASNATMVE